MSEFIGLDRSRSPGKESLRGVQGSPCPPPPPSSPRAAEPGNCSSSLLPAPPAPCAPCDPAEIGCPQALPPRAAAGRRATLAWAGSEAGGRMAWRCWRPVSGAALGRALRAGAGQSRAGAGRFSSLSRGFATAASGLHQVSGAPRSSSRALGRWGFFWPVTFPRRSSRGKKKPSSFALARRAS